MLIEKELMSPGINLVQHQNPEVPGLMFLRGSLNLVLGHLQDRNNPQIPIRAETATVKEIHSVLYRERSDKAGLSDVRPSCEEMLDICRQIMDWSPRTAHPHFVSQIYSRADLYGIGAEVIVAALNNNVHVFQLSPALTVIEKVTVEYLSDVFGFGAVGGAGYAEGAFVPGGSLGNLHALYVALHKFNPALREDGLPVNGKQLVAFCGEGAHYSIEKAAMALGIGRSNMRKVPTDTDGRMRVDLLEAAIIESVAHGETPFCVCATAGTTVLCAFDQLVPISEVVRRYGLWLHVDAAWGGAAAFSPRHEHLLNGLDQADSLTFSAHKMLGAPIQCVAFLVHARHPGLLQRAMSLDAPYLYQNSTGNRNAEPDLSRMTLQCGRRGDALKLWLMREALGDAGLSRRIDDCVAWAEGFRSEIQLRESKGSGFILYKCSFSTVCFWYVPRAMLPVRVMDLEHGTADWNVVDEIPDKVRNEMIESNDCMLVSYGSTTGLPRFFRLGLSSAPGTQAQCSSSIEIILNHIENIAERVFAVR
ncbi:sulfinoalanine decarboxylase [Bradyrhizobium algeriense]|uniref:Sulfinoalanine decarboxylase n=1 Tax=Bradyrhizobium algeriense TaxID=634784 RepID=A0ABU8BHK9_9BRAD